MLLAGFRLFTDLVFCNNLVHIVPARIVHGWKVYFRSARHVHLIGFIDICPEFGSSTRGEVMKELERTWDKNGSKLTMICKKHRKIDCNVCAKSREWDELVRRVSKQH